MNQVSTIPSLPSSRSDVPSLPLHNTKLEWMRDSFGLTATEFRILQYLARGNTPQQIADFNNSAVATVRVHMQSIYKKTRVKHVIGLMALMMNGPTT